MKILDILQVIVVGVDIVDGVLVACAKGEDVVNEFHITSDDCTLEVEEEDAVAFLIADGGRISQEDATNSARVNLGVRVKVANEAETAKRMKAREVGWRSEHELMR